MRFSNFPKKQEVYLVYSSYKGFRSKLFDNLYIQISPKNSFFFRALKTDLSFFLNLLIRQKLSVPKLKGDYIGIVKQGVIIFFELENKKPKWVWRRNDNAIWEKSLFLGYQLISEYTVKQFSSKYKLIEKTLKKQWDLVNENVINIHGDFTHFNILYNEKEELHFIDRKSQAHSKLFDIFYFYSYLRQCLSRCRTLSEKEELIIVARIKDIIKKVCLYESEIDMKMDYDRLNIPEVSGLIDKNTYMDDFFCVLKKD